MSIEEWKPIIENYPFSGMTVEEYCRNQGVCVSSFYKFKRRLHDEHPEAVDFIPVTVVDHAFSDDISICIDGHTLQFNPQLLERIIGALK
jgi:hypothetical protein